MNFGRAPLANRGQKSHRWVTGPHLCALLLTLFGCDSQQNIIDPFPISFHHQSGAAVVGGAIGDEDPVRVALDTLSPITTIDRGANAPINQVRDDVSLFAVDPSGTVTVRRARYGGIGAFEMHTCGDQPRCRLGRGDDALEIDGIIGADVLARTAVVINYAQGQINLFPDVAGDNPTRRQTCESEFPSPFAGGGVLRVGDNTEVFDGNRPALHTCLGAGEGIASRDRGTDVLLVLATGLPISMLSESAYERYRTATGSPALSELPTDEIHTYRGTFSLPVVSVTTASLSGETRAGRGACRELYANRVMSAGGCNAAGVGDCPCLENNDFCRAGSAVLLRTAMDFAIIPEEDVLLQSLRDELRPALPEVDGLLSSAALAPLRVALDYPNQRILMRCEVPGECVTRPVTGSTEAAMRFADICPADPGPPTVE